MNNSQKKRKFWGILLILDAALMLAFGMALAATIRTHWKPALSQVEGTKGHVIASPPPPPPPEPAQKEPIEKPAGSVAQGLSPAGLTPATAAKALKVEFRYKNAKAKKVVLAGSFIPARFGFRKELRKEKGGNWALTLYIKPGAYRYHFLVDGRKTLDPGNKNSAKGRSILNVEAVN